VARPTAPPGAATVVNLTINLVAGDGVTAAQLSDFATRAQAPVENYFNCQSGTYPQPTLTPAPGASAVPCPPDAANRTTPPVTFRIHYVPGGSGQPLVTIHRCYHASLPAASAGSCTAVEAEQRRSCVERGEGAGAALTACLAQVRATDGGGRPNAGNYGLGAGDSTLAHEAAHLMGLDDEYSMADVPFNPLGEHDSIMNRSQQYSSRLYPRHFRTILQPASCRAGAGP
jgi:hypothetical protein